MKLCVNSPCWSPLSQTVPTKGVSHSVESNLPHTLRDSNNTILKFFFGLGVGSLLFQSLPFTRERSHEDDEASLSTVSG